MIEKEYQDEEGGDWYENKDDEVYEANSEDVSGESLVTRLFCLALPSKKDPKIVYSFGIMGGSKA